MTKKGRQFFSEKNMVDIVSYSTWWHQP